jgi:hypothetical protein
LILHFTQRRRRSFEAVYHKFPVEGEQRIVRHGGCGAGLIREATRGNTTLLCESGTFHRNLRNSHAVA